MLIMIRIITIPSQRSGIPARADGTDGNLGRVAGGALAPVVVSGHSRCRRRFGGWRADRDFNMGFERCE